MLQQFIQWVKDLYGRITGQRTQKELRRGEVHKLAYEDDTKTNFTAIFANAIASKAISDSTMTIADANGGNSRRSDFIDMCLKAPWNGLKKTVDTALGKGGVFLVPYVSNGRVYISAVDQTYCDVLDVDGDGNILAIAIKAETAQVEQKFYTRTMYITLSNGVLTIEQKAVDRFGEVVPLDTVPAWADIEELHDIANVEKIPVAYLRCPKSDRMGDTFYGVPITYGCGETIEQIMECLSQIRQEYTLKKAFVGADEFLFGKDNTLPDDGLFKMFQGAGGLNGQPFWEIYDPAFRDSAYYNRFHELCAQLEREVGTSKGILTEPNTAAATATEIKAANKATFDIVSDIRKNIEACFDILAYAVDIYAEHYGLTPMGNTGDYTVTFDWDFSMIESSEETFSQYSELQSRGLITGARLVALATGMSMDEAQVEVEAAQKEQEPVVEEPDTLEPDADIV